MTSDYLDIDIREVRGLPSNGEIIKIADTLHSHRYHVNQLSNLCSIASSSHQIVEAGNTDSCTSP